MEILGANPNHCTYEYAYEMYGAHCAGLRLSKLPNLRGGIEILDFSENKLKEISPDTFSGYSSIKYLYLGDNQLYYIDKDGLTSLTYLETLDLSNNVIFDLPTTIFQLPSLRKLYLKGNPLLQKSFKNLDIPKPIKAPLELLDLSDCRLTELPYLGILPQMNFYNISLNPLARLDTKHFAAMCNLAKVDLTESLDDMKLCDLKPVVSWFQMKHIFFQLADYDRLNTHEFANCNTTTLQDQQMHNATYHSCKTEYLKVQSIRTSRRTWLTIGGGLCGFLIGFILLLWIMHRHNVAQTKSTAEKLKDKKPQDSDKNASANLLNNAAYN